MNTRQLGKNGPMVSTLGLGAWPIGGGMGHVDEKVAIATIRTALDAGVTLLDTAQIYRSSEVLIGRALQDGYKNKAFVATKVSGNYSAKAVFEAAENSLRAMQIDVIDLYQIHWWDDKYPLEETMAALLQLQEKGLVRYLGVSNFTDKQMKMALQYGRYEVNQFCYNLFQRQTEETDIPFCEQHGISVLAHSAMAKGLLTGKYKPNHRFPDDDERSKMTQFQGESFALYLNAAEQLQGIAKQKGLTPAQFAVAWPLHNDIVASVLIGAKTPEQVKSLVEAANITFSNDELAQIRQILAGIPQLHNPQRKE